MSKKTKRLLIHIPFGLLIVASLRLHWIMPAVLAFLFWFYERNEDHWIRDRAYLDVAGVLYGMSLGVIVWAALKIIGVGVDS